MNISLVVPLYNEENNIDEFIKQVANSLYNTSYKILFIDDGSTDETKSKIKKLSEENTYINYISFSKNFGHQTALKAGLDHADGDCVISLDGDLQHPPELIPDMLKEWNAGNDIVYTKRKDDKNLSYFKRKSSQIFYSLMNRLTDLELENGSADFRLLDRKVVDYIKQFNEVNLFLRGLIKWIGFSSKCIEYEQKERFSGETKYTFKKMFKFAIDGITSFSIKPLRMITSFGLFLSICSFLYIVYAIINYFVFKNAVSGWTSIIICILFLGGVQLIVLGIIGEYIGKIYIQSKHRPLYILEETSLKKT
jgi:polyisoprenyl-phosphate glycosyltransferase